MRVANDVEVRVQVLQKFPCCCWLLLLECKLFVVIMMLVGLFPPATVPCHKTKIKPPCDGRLPDHLAIPYILSTSMEKKV